MHTQTQSEYTTKQGWQKILFTCAQALDDGIEWAWIDACCIDKSSSAELSEAINSMFFWYWRARVCYAFLEDISYQPRREDESVQACDLSLWQPGSEGSHERFRPSRWFTRGWTLQELIAPTQLRLYDRDWRMIGDRASMTSALQELTGIDQQVLCWSGSGMPPDDSITALRRHLDGYSIAQRMYWASSRSTSRPEDVAYSLLGLFNVNMPLLYGEGSKAFIRLQEELIKASTDDTIFAWHHTKIDRLKVRDRGSDGQSRLLADHPAQFAHSSNIVCRHHGVHHHAYELTNAGLSITAPVIHEDSAGLPKSWVILNCCHRERPFAALALRLYYSKEGKHYEVSRSSRNLRPTLPGFLRLDEESRGIRLETITIARCSKSSSSPPLSLKSVTSRGCVIIETDMNNTPIELLQTAPTSGIIRSLLHSQFVSLPVAHASGISAVGVRLEINQLFLGRKSDCQIDVIIHSRVRDTRDRWNHLVLHEIKLALVLVAESRVDLRQRVQRYEMQLPWTAESPSGSLNDDVDIEDYNATGPEKALLAIPDSKWAVQATLFPAGPQKGPWIVQLGVQEVVADASDNAHVSAAPGCSEARLQVALFQERGGDGSLTEQPAVLISD